MCHAARTESNLYKRSSVRVRRNSDHPRWFKAEEGTPGEDNILHLWSICSVVNVERAFLKPDQEATGCQDHSVVDGKHTRASCLPHYICIPDNALNRAKEEVFLVLFALRAFVVKAGALHPRILI